MKKVFRTTFKYWASQEGGGLFFTAACATFFFWFRGYWLGCFCLMGAIFWLKDILRLRQNHVEINEQEFISINNQKELRIRWSDVIAARFERGSSASKFLSLWTAEQEVSIPIHQFDYRQIMRLAEQYVSPSAFEESALLKTPAHEKFMAETAQKVAVLELPLHVSDHWIIKFMGWGLLAFCLPAVFALLVYQEILLAIVPLIFAVLGIIFTLNSGSLEIDREKLSRKTLLGRYQMRWNEVKWIEHHEQESGWLLCGENKQLGIISPFWCSKKNREMYMALLMFEIQQRQIEMKRDWRVLYKYSKNTRVS